MKKHLNRQVKDNVFKKLFSKEKTMLNFLKSEGFNIEELKSQPISPESIKGIFLTGEANDVGYLFSNLLIVLLEAQSTFVVQNIIRFFRYGLTEYLNFLNSNLDLVKLPQLTIFCIYTGNKKLKREYKLTKDFYNQEFPYNSLEFTVYIIDKENTKDPIIDQYITFSQRITQLWYEGKTTPEDVAEFLKQAVKEGILVELIKENMAEVPEMIENEIKSRGDLLIKEAETKGLERGISIGEKRGISIGEKRGISIGEENNLKNNIENLAKRLRIQNNKLTMEEALKQAKEWLTEPV